MGDYQLVMNSIAIASSLSAIELHQATGVLLTTLQAKLPLWVKWEYLNRRAVSGKRPHYTYTIAERGAKFVSLRIPLDKYAEYVREINDQGK